MSEVVKYQGKRTTIGTCENIYYVDYKKYLCALNAGYLSFAEGNLKPREYLNPEYGFRFRFPFPDEDKLPFAVINDHFERGEPVTVDQSVLPDPAYAGNSYTIYVTQQKLIQRQSDGELCLALVFRDQSNELHRVEEDAEVKKILHQIIKHHVLDNPDQEQKLFYRKIAVRILKGYRFKPALQTQVLSQQKALPAKKSVIKSKGLR
jgi:hypothetical protein